MRVVYTATKARVKGVLVEKSKKSEHALPIFAENGAYCGKGVLAPAIPLGKKWAFRNIATGSFRAPKR
jgi:hypothetical protein